MRKRSNVDKHADANVVPSKRHRTDLDNFSGASQSDDWGIQVMSNDRHQATTLKQTYSIRSYKHTHTIKIVVIAMLQRRSVGDCL